MFLSCSYLNVFQSDRLQVLTDKLEVDAIFSRVEWTTLIFFASLFVVMEALSELGFLKWIGDLVEQVKPFFEKGQNVSEDLTYTARIKDLDKLNLVKHALSG